MRNGRAPRMWPKSCGGSRRAERRSRSGYVVAKIRPAQRLLYTEITAPENTAFEFDGAAAVLSPDGSRIAFVAKPGRSGGAASRFARTNRHLVKAPR